jgi:hypothetical protein
MLDSYKTINNCDGSNLIENNTGILYDIFLFNKTIIILLKNIFYSNTYEDKIKILRGILLDSYYILYANIILLCMSNVIYTFLLAIIVK